MRRTNSRHTVRARTLARAAGIVAAAGLSVTVLSGCADWWTPQLTQEQLDEQADVGNPKTSDLQSLGVTTAELPGLWNADAKADESPVVLPDPIVPDSDSTGLATASIDVGGLTAKFDWNVDSDLVTSAELTGPIGDDPATSESLPVIESFLAAALGLSPAEANAYTEALIAAAVAEADDPANVAHFAEDDEVADVVFVITDGALQIIVTPKEGSA